MKPKTVCDCGNRLTEKQIARGGEYCSVKCDGKYRPRGPAKRGFTLEQPTNKKRRTLGPGFRAFVDGEIRPVPREGTE